MRACICAGIFSPGNPLSFQSNYLASQSLLCELEGLATSRAAVERLRGSAAAAGWAKRWNLPVYFSLVYQDIAGGRAGGRKARPAERAEGELRVKAVACWPIRGRQADCSESVHVCQLGCCWGDKQDALAGLPQCKRLLSGAKVQDTIFSGRMHHFRGHTHYCRRQAGRLQLLELVSNNSTALLPHAATSMLTCVSC